MIKNLKRRNMEAFYCKTAEEAVSKVSELIADGSSVTWGGSMTIRDMGIPQALKDRGTLEVLDRDVVTDRDEVEYPYRGWSSNRPTSHYSHQLSVLILYLLPPLPSCNKRPPCCDASDS